MAKRKKKQAPTKADSKPSQKRGEDGLTSKQRVFVDEYLKDFCATKAAIRAGYSKKTAGEQGYQLLQKPSICAVLNRAIKERRDRTKMEGDEVLLEYAKLARSDILNYLSFGPNGVAIRESTELTEGEGRAIQEISETFNSQGQSQIKIRLHSKQSALDSLAKHLKLYEENPVNVNISWMDLVKSAKAAKAAQVEAEAQEAAEAPDGE